MRAKAAIVLLGFAMAVQPAQAYKSCPASPPVFFDFGSAEISRDAAAILSFVAHGLQRCTVQAVTITGHIDTAEASAGMDLGRARAEAVRAMLIEYGLGADRFSIQDASADQLAVQTEADVRSPLNRYVSIEGR